ncbi:P-loop containing nucleoside triphosphate hydrolase protein [Zopfochytrium polystomum]|nr:P-loop containing nucleoside triphosphate hydrolase protein [Zopfochytrium polystomum]
MTTVKFESKDYPGTFAFDKIFDWSTTQQQVFDYAAGAVIEDVMRGYNGTIFAYGQTGSGKTHTMMGDMESDEVKGLTPRLVESIFDTIFKAPPNLEFTVKVSYMEIYMEKIKDLLNPSQDNLPIHEEKNRGVYVKGLLEVFVGSVDEVYDAMRRGQDARVVASTNMNAESSRSHSIFVIQVSLKNLLDGSSRTGKLYLVDLAGSEKVGKTGATGQTLEEAKKINKSLSALGMVINALTDGKSSHIPYRDSKLTRILQESLGGNSRTTLIINCSPSSFNEAETLSTLRFGMRAKTIKNKAKVNAELSPAELKNLLKKVKQDVSTLQTYVTALETEVKTWRSGGSVAQADWAVAPAGLPTADGAPAPAASAIPPSVTQERSSTPAAPLTEDEREEFLKRESELSDQYAEAQAALKSEKARAEAAAEELAFLKTRDEEVTKENKQMAEDFVKLKLELEKLSSENKEGVIVVDSLKEANTELNKEIEALKAQIVELQAAKAAAPAPADPSEEKERKKMEKMAQMMAEFDPTALMSEKEKQIRLNLSQLVHQDAANSKPPSNPDEIAAQHIELVEAKTLLAGQDRAIEDLTTKLRVAQEESSVAKKRREEAEAKVSTLESEYQELLERTLREEEQSGGVELASTIQEIKNKLEAQYATRKGAQEKEIETLKAAVTRQETEVSGLQLQLSELQRSNEDLKSQLDSAKAAAAAAGTDAIPRSDELDKIRQKMGQQLGEFDAMKKKLMRDLQNRCEKVVELEISLDETREQYNTVLRNSNSRAQQQKMAFLERNLEQLTHVQRQLVEQNASIKKELGVAERKLVARSERVSNLEALLADTQTKLELQNQKFEAQLATMREKLQEARSANPQPTSWLYSSRIAKPLRGGGAAAGMSGEDESDFAEAASKRSSWYVSLLKKN